LPAVRLIDAAGRVLPDARFALLNGMFKHVLIPTDGSALSEAAASEGIRFARDIGAQVTLLHVCTPFHPLAWDVEALTDTRAEYERSRIPVLVYRSPGRASRAKLAMDQAPPGKGRLWSGA
jgi:hypothetical protein